MIAFAGDSTWHWTMEGFDDEHKRFWRQVVLWLAHKDETAEGNVWIKLAQRRATVQQSSTQDSLQQQPQQGQGFGGGQDGQGSGDGSGW